MPIFGMQFSKLQNKVETAESRVSVLESMIDDLQWDIDKIRKREQRLNRHLAEVLERASAVSFIVWRLESFSGVCSETMDLGSSFLGKNMFLWKYFAYQTEISGSLTKESLSSL